MPGVQENLAAVRETAVALKLVGVPALTELFIGFKMEKEERRDEEGGRGVNT